MGEEKCTLFLKNKHRLQKVFNKKIRNNGDKKNARHVLIHVKSRNKSLQGSNVHAMLNEEEEGFEGFDGDVDIRLLIWDNIQSLLQQLASRPKRGWP